MQKPKDSPRCPCWQKMGPSLIRFAARCIEHPLKVPLGLCAFGLHGPFAFHWPRPLALWARWATSRGPPSNPPPLPTPCLAQPNLCQETLMAPHKHNKINTRIQLHGHPARNALPQCPIHFAGRRIGHCGGAPPPPHPQKGSTRQGGKQKEARTHPHTPQTHSRNARCTPPQNVLVTAMVGATHV